MKVARIAPPRPRRRTLLLAAASSLAPPALAQRGPAVVVVGSTPGGTTDTLGRGLAKALTDTTGRAYVVENRAGAGGNIAAAHVARSPADGNTLLIALPGHTVAPSLYPKLSYDAIRDFTPLTMIARVPNVLVARKDAPYDTLAGLIGHARREPGKVALAVAGQGSSLHLATEDLKLRTGISFNAVPYKGTTAALVDIAGGTVDAMFAGSVSALPHLARGGVKALGVGSAAPLRQLPGVPPMSESLPGFETMAWFGVLAPAGLDAATRDALVAAIATATAQPDYLARLDTEAAIPVRMSQPEFAAFLRRDLEYWADVVRRAGIRLDG